MKTAIYIEDGTTQLVLTPETEYEKEIVRSFGKRLNTVKVFEGQFYDCRGGWVRQSAWRDRGSLGSVYDRYDTSLIMRIGTDEDQP